MNSQKLVNYLKKGSEQEKWFAAEIIGAEKNHKYYEILVDSINDYAVDEVVVWCLGKMRKQKSISFLINKLEKTKDTYVIHRTVEALTDIGDSAVPELIKFLSNSKNDEARWRVAKTLGEKKYVKAFDILWKCVNDKNKFVRWRAIWAIKSLGGKIIPALIEKYDNSNEYLRWRILWVLGQIGTESILKTIKEIEHKENSEFVKWQARQSINQIRKIRDN
ncbi:MAG: HEAT repeat domain-containing protein [archaeon]